MKSALMLILILIFDYSFAENSDLIYLNQWFEKNEVKRLDCFLADHSSDDSLNDKSDRSIEFNLNNHSKLVTISDAIQLEELNKLIQKSTLVRKINYVTLLERYYDIFVIHFSNGTKISILNSSSFGVDQFCFIDLVELNGKFKLRTINFYCDDVKKMEIALMIPGFRGSKFFKNAVLSDKK